MKSPELSALNEAIVNVAPGTTIFVAEAGDVTLTFPEDATQDQKDAAQGVLDDWNYTPADWQSFQDRLSAAIVFAVGASDHATLIFTRLNNLAVGQGAGWDGDSDRLVLAWNNSPPVLTSEQETELNAVATEYNIPLHLHEGTLTAI